MLSSFFLHELNVIIAGLQLLVSLAGVLFIGALHFVS